MKSILSVGIDIGTTTTQIVFSELIMENTAGYFTVPRVAIVDKKVIYSSETYMTPLMDDVLIDADAVKRILIKEYDSAKISPDSVGAGAVIVTGESARKDNAQALIQGLSGFAGEFVVSTAGPDLESVIAGKGSGAYAYSQKHKNRVINLDVGGGTTNVVLFDSGKVISTGCVDIGGRLVRLDDENAVIHISKSAQCIADANGIPLFPGMQNQSALVRLVECMAMLIDQMIGQSTKTKLLNIIKTPHSADFECSGVIDAICFSGGVADSIYGKFANENDYRFGDIGIILGRAIAKSKTVKEHKVCSFGETLRATVIGAGSYATTVSGSTITAQPEILPLKNLPVLRLEEKEYEQLCLGDIHNFKERIEWMIAQNANNNIAISMEGECDPSYHKLSQFAKSIVTAYENALPETTAIITVVETDIAKALGQLMRRMTDKPIISIDGVSANTQDYIDIGKPVMDGLVVPVVVKTLVFGR